MAGIMSSNTPIHPTLGDVRTAFQSKTLSATEFRGCTTLVVQSEDLHEIMHFLRQDPACDYNLLVDVTAADYLDYPAPQPARFGVTWVLRSHAHDRMLLDAFERASPRTCAEADAMLAEAERHATRLDALSYVLAAILRLERPGT